MFSILVTTVTYLCIISYIYDPPCVLQEFVNHDHWMHLDIAGVMGNKSEVPYLPKGMAGKMLM